MDQENFSVIAFKLFPKENPTHGTIKPLFIIDNNNLIEVTSENFCATGKVFVAQNYDEIDAKFEDQELFKISVSRSSILSDKVDPTNASKYVANGKNAERLPAKLLVQIIQAELPDPNNRIVSVHNIIPSTKFVFIRNSKNMTYGPFEWHIDGDNILGISLIASPIPGPKLEQGQIYALTEDQASKHRILSSTSREYLQDLAMIIQGAAFYDYASDLEIIHYCGLQATTFKTNALEKRTLKNLEVQAKALPNQLFKSRWERFNSLSVEVINSQEEVVRHVSEFLNSDNGSALIHLHIERNSDRYLKDEIVRQKDKIVSETNKFNEEHHQVSERLKKIKEDTRQALAELQDALSERDRLPQITAEVRHAELDALLSEKQVELTKIEDSIKQRHPVETALISLEEIQRKTQEAQQGYKHWINEEAAIKRIIESLKHEYSRTEEDIVKDLAKMSPMVKTINGFTGMATKDLPNVTIRVNQDFDATNIFDAQEKVCSAIMSAMASKGRIVTQLEVVNLLICTQQSFITFLSGLPGAGKTSIARLLAHTQGLGTRLNEVSVGRGWTSQKDLIGFYNPLVGKFQPSNTGMYEFLLALRNDFKESTYQPMAYVLLDEANLSPIEHYWSSFFGMTDSDGSRAITLGSDQIPVPNYIRFLATINHDGTTEPLSPRAIDRAPFIVMDSGELNIEDSLLIQETANLFPLSSSDMDHIFGNTKSVPPFNEAEELIFKQIKKVLTDPTPDKGRPITISIRKEHAVRQYCNRARVLMYGDGDLVALDFAILQFVLPLIRGTGTKFAKRLDELKLILLEQSMNQSNQYLDRMINYGASELHSYDFFCW